MLKEAPLCEWVDTEGQPLSKRIPEEFLPLVGQEGLTHSEVFLGRGAEWELEKLWIWLLYQIERQDIESDCGRHYTEMLVKVDGPRTPAQLLEQYTRLQVKDCLGYHEKKVRDKADQGFGYERQVFQAPNCVNAVNNLSCWHCLDVGSGSHMNSVDFRIKAAWMLFDALGRSDLTDRIDTFSKERDELQWLAFDGDTHSISYFAQGEKAGMRDQIIQGKKVLAEGLRPIIDGIIEGMESLGVDKKQ